MTQFNDIAYLKSIGLTKSEFDEIKSRIDNEDLSIYFEGAYPQYLIDCNVLGQRGLESDCNNCEHQKFCEWFYAPLRSCIEKHSKGKI